MLANGHSLESYAKAMQAPGMAYDRLVRIQRGETLMQLADLVNWAQHFDNIKPLLADSRTWPDVADSVAD
jgi:CO/xanthine dehydrogenase Mo-binding subunit